MVNVSARVSKNKKTGKPEFSLISIKRFLTFNST